MGSLGLRITILTPRISQNSRNLTSYTKFINPILQNSRRKITPKSLTSTSTSSSLGDYFYWLPMSTTSSVIEAQPTGLPKYINANAVGSSEGLETWLRTRMTEEDLVRWGVEPGTKTIENLWNELVEGEITLEDSCPPKRTVNVASISIRCPNSPGRVLIESHQMLSDGNTRSRNRPLSEKMKPGETLQEACLRGISEELGGVLGPCPDNGRVRLLLDSYSKDVQERDSVSYPGLPCCYVLHSVDAVVRGLPSEDFSTDEDEEHQGSGKESVSGVRKKTIGVTRHFWKWVHEEES